MMEHGRQSKETESQRLSASSDVTHPSKARVVLCHTTPTSKPKKLGTDFPETISIWTGGKFRYLGSGIKFRTVLFIKIQLYAVALYVEEEDATRELQRMQKEGFFKDYSDDTLCAALVRGNFKKFLQIQLLRDVTYSQFTGEIGRDLKPQLDRTGDDDLWNQFEDYFKDKDLSRNSNLLALIKENGECEGGLFPPGFDDFEHAKVGLYFPNPNFASALSDVYLGAKAIVPDAKSTWARSALALLKGA